MFGAIGITVAWNFVPTFGFVLGAAYLVFAFAQMYLVMPLAVCPHCVYYSIEAGRCVSGMNLVSRALTKQGDPDRFADRAKGLLSHNKLYMAALVAPLLIMPVGMVAFFWWPPLAIWLILAGLMAFRIFVIFPKVACVHCAAKRRCPNAQSMGLSEG